MHNPVDWDTMKKKINKLNEKVPYWGATYIWGGDFLAASAQYNHLKSYVKLLPFIVTPIILDHMWIEGKITK